MEPNVKMELKNKTITDFFLRYNPQLGATQINIDTNGTFGKPVDGANKAAGAIIVRIEAKAEKPEEFHLLLIETFEYSFEETPEDYDVILQAIYSGAALPQAAEDLDTALIALGKAPIKIKDML